MRFVNALDCIVDSAKREVAGDYEYQEVWATPQQAKGQRAYGIKVHMPINARVCVGDTIKVDIHHKSKED
jgi:hypothetical protein